MSGHSGNRGVAKLLVRGAKRKSDVRGVALDETFGRVIERGQYEQRQQRCDSQATNDDGSEATLNVATNACGERRGKHAEGGDSGGHQHRPETLRGAGKDRLVQRSVLRPYAVEVGDHNYAVLHG